MAMLSASSNRQERRVFAGERSMRAANCRFLGFAIILITARAPCRVGCRMASKMRLLA